MSRRRPRGGPEEAMTDLSADMVQQKQRLREKLRFRRKHFAANLDGMAQLAAFRALPAPLSERLAGHAVVRAYAAWGDETDTLPMPAGVAEAGALAPPHRAAPLDAIAFWHRPTAPPLSKGPLR